MRIILNKDPGSSQSILKGSPVSKFNSALDLSQLRPSDSCVVVSVDSTHPSCRRLIELGFVEGEKIQVMHVAPISKDPMVLVVGDIRLALRRDEAAAVKVSRINIPKG